jgi:hypothetical protein
MKKCLVQMRWNLLWFVPFAASLVGLACLNATYADHNSLILLHERWRAFSYLLSPSADVWVIVNIVSISAPLQMAMIIPGLFDPCDGWQHRYRRVATWIARFLGLMAVLPGLDRGSFPLVRLGDGSVYMRMIPFL